MISEALLHEGFVRTRQIRLIQLDGATDQQLTFGQRERGQLGKDVGETHVGKLV